MRFSLTAALLAVSLSAFAQTSGSYQGSAWSIDSTHNLVWAGQPYVPVGLRVNADQIRNAKKEGFNDVIVDLSPTGSDWGAAIHELEANRMRYIISVDGLLPPCKCFAVEPEAYRVDGITSDRHVSISLPGATSALAVLVTQRDSGVESFARVPITDGKFEYDVKTQTDLDEVLLIYPEQTEASHPDYWDGFDARRDMLLGAVVQNKPGSGLRGILNPLGRMFESRFGTSLFVPDSTFFRQELSSYLQSKYRNVQTAERSWSMSGNDLDTFDEVARLIPLWSGTRGIGELWDPETDRLYGCDSHSAQAWNDINQVIADASAKRFERLVPAVQQVADVPVLQEWTGWEAPFEATQPELSGIGFEAQGSDSQAVIDDSSRPTSSLLRWRSPGWLVCTHLDVDRDPNAPTDFRMLLDQMESMGVRGWFLKNPSAAVVAAAANDISRREADTASASAQVSPLYFPEDAFNPAIPKRLPGGRWWLPSPADGNRIDFGAGFFGYEYTDGQSYTTVIWSSLPGRVKLDMPNPKSALFQRVDGLDPKPKYMKDGVEIDMDDTPLMVNTTGAIPVPDPSLVQTASRFEQLVSYGDSLHLDTGVDGLFLHNALASFKVDPGAAFVQMRNHFWDLNRRLGTFTWIEAESPSSTNFSQILPESGCSGGSALVLRTPLTTDPNGFHATYEANIRSNQDLEVWLAARIPSEDLPYVSIEVAGQRLSAMQGPVGTYSSGYGWYKFGVTKVLGGSADVTVNVNSPQGAYLALDAILLYPASLGTFKPNGTEMPDAVQFVEGKGKGKKGKG